MIYNWKYSICVYGGACTMSRITCITPHINIMLSTHENHIFIPESPRHICPLIPTRIWQDVSTKLRGHRERPG